MKTLRRILPVAVLALGSIVPAHALVLYSGSATWTVNEGFAQSLGWLDANFTGIKTRPEVLNPSQTSDGDYNRISGSSGTLGTSTTPGFGYTPGQVVVTDTIRPFGEVPLNDAGGTTPGQVGNSRTRQATTLDFDPTDVLGSWSQSNNAFAFTGNSALGEQIAFTGMQRWGGPFTGVLAYGDFGLRYNGTQLVLTSNIDFLNAEFATLGNPVINYSAETGLLSITGNLLVGEGLFVLDTSAAIGASFGTFSFTGSTVPEPSTYAAIFGLFAAGAALSRRRKRVL